MLLRESENKYHILEARIKSQEETIDKNKK